MPRSSWSRREWAGVGLAAVVLSCGGASSPAAPSAAPPPGPASWALAWSDEFETPGLPDPGKWGYEVGYVRNQELQYYTASRRENARAEDGMLVIESRREPWQGFEYTSASLNTRGRHEFLYGRVEVRAKLPTGRGMWPAIWMLGVNIASVGWPACGEIDIMENVGFDPPRIHFSIHTDAYNHVKNTQKSASVAVAAPWDQFHEYALEWTRDRIDMFVDGVRTFSYVNDGAGWQSWPFDKPQYLLINAAVGGSWGGQRGVDPSIFPQRYYIDYVRIFRQGS